MLDEYDQILRRRATPVVRSHLAERIVDAARSRVQERVPLPVMLMNTFRQVFLMPPQPAVAFGVILFIGVVAGINISAAQATLTPQELAASLMVEDVMSGGEWL